jgi:sensor histidine kinase regulating citrate/malate metabolism
MAIAVKNKCSDYDPNVKTSKKDTVLHGIGLKTVRRIIKELNGEIKIIYKNNVFSVNIILPTEK